MFKYFPHTDKDIQEMLKVIGVNSLDDLFSDVPEEVKIKGEIDIPNSLSEIELREKVYNIVKKNKAYTCFLGAGSYDCYTPSVVNTICSREEFLTAYTPYQAEISQGTLQYIFEYQTLMCNLTGLDVGNASNYDGATATMEAMLMCVNQTRKNKVLLLDTLNPRTIEVVQTLAKYKGIEIGLVSREEIINNLNSDVAGVICANPNYYGEIDDYSDIADAIHNNKSLLVVNTDPSTLPLLKTPGEMGADIACGEAQTLGIPLSFGGPYLGFICCKNYLMRKLPGRIVGMTTDKDGNRGYVLTLQAREQHIRREKANSNICSNQSLMALMATIYGATLGKEGMKEVANKAYQNAHYLVDKLLKTNKFTLCSNKEFFKETLLKTDLDIDDLNKYLLDNGILGGLNLKEGKYLVCATEVRTKAEIDKFVSLVEAYDVR